MLPLGSIPLTGPLGKQLTNVSLQLDRAVFVNVVSVVRSKISAWTVKFLAQLCDVGGLPDSQGAEIQRSAAALAAELKNQRPDPSRIREALRAIRTVAQGAAGNVIAVGIVQLINRLLGA